MSKVRVAGFTVSADGYGADIEQSLEAPMGKRGHDTFSWFFGTKSFRSMIGKEGGATEGPDAEFARLSMHGFGAFVMGRNMFGAERGPWKDLSWKGWWGDDPPYHAPTFILTHHPRESITMEGGTTFHFVTGGIEDALERAKKAAGEKDVKIGGGVATFRQYLQARLIDSLHLAIAPVFIGQGEALFAGIDLPTLGYEIVDRQTSEHATHLVIERK
ncbi:MAG TPA: dihydrofolate reductase family protein [Polyangiaceae bacterium]